jgi:hypothetical protein
VKGISTLGSTGGGQLQTLASLGLVLGMLAIAAWAVGIGIRALKAAR